MQRRVIWHLNMDVSGDLSLGCILAWGSWETIPTKLYDIEDSNIQDRRAIRRDEPLTPSAPQYGGQRMHPGYSSRYRAGRPRGRSSSPSRGKAFLLSTSSRPVLGLTQPPIKCVPGALPLGRRGQSGWHVKLTAHLQLVPRSRRCYTSAPPQIPHDLTWYRIRADAAGSRRLWHDHAVTKTEHVKKNA
jgi:hypothetical protein